MWLPADKAISENDALWIFITTVERLQFAQKPPTLHIYAFLPCCSLLWVKAAVKRSIMSTFSLPGRYGRGVFFPLKYLLVLSAVAGGNTYTGERLTLLIRWCFSVDLSCSVCAAFNRKALPALKQPIFRVFFSGAFISAGGFSLSHLSVSSPIFPVITHNCFFLHQNSSGRIMSHLSQWEKWMLDYGDLHFNGAWRTLRHTRASFRPPSASAKCFQMIQN